MLYIKERRKELGITQTDLAKRSGVLQSTICDIEAGKKTRQTVETAQKLAQFFGTHIDDLLVPYRSDEHDPDRNDDLSEG